MSCLPNPSPDRGHPAPKPGLFPWLSLFAGIVGAALQYWLFSQVDSRGLLPRNSAAGILSVLLLAFTLLLCFFTLRKTPLPRQYSRQFPRSGVAALLQILAAIGLGYSGFVHTGTGLLNVLLTFFSVIGALSLLGIAVCRARGTRPIYLLRCAVTACLMLRTVVCCRGWSTQPQLALYFFPLLASVFLLLAAYYHTELDAETGSYRRYCLCNQVALLCCCLCLPGEEPLFYLTGVLWMTADSLGLGRSPEA